MAKHPVCIKRIYEAPAKGDGFRVLVDGIWPRGIKKTEAAIDDWIKAVAPTKELRQWFGHDPEKWPEFRKKYRTYLRETEVAHQALEEIRKHAKNGKVTLLFAAKNEEQNNAVVLAELLR